MRWRRSSLEQVVSIVVGAPTLVALALYAGLFARSMWQHPTLRQFIILSFGWQTMVGACLAIVAALIGARVVLHQINETRRNDEERRMRRATALRAVLTLGLIEIYDYVAACALIYAGLLLTQFESQISSAGIQIPLLPDDLVKQFTDLIETLGRVDGFNQDEAAREADQGGLAFRALFAA